jgi:hypothetical protein
MSIEDRVAAVMFGPQKQRAPQPTPPVKQQEAQPETPDQPEDVEAAATPDGEQPPAETAPEYEEVEYEGELYQVPPKLKEGIIRHQDYTRKTQEVAEQRRMVEYKQKELMLAESDRKFSEAARTETSELAQIDAQLRQYSAVDLRQLSMEDAFRVKMEVDTLKEKRQALDSTLQQKYQQWQQEVQKSHQELIQHGLEAVKKAIPNFSADTVKEIQEAAVRDGYSESEVQSILDPRYVKTLWKAAQYDKLVSQRNNGKAAVQKAPPIQKVTPSNPMSQQTKEYLAYRRAVTKAKPGTQEHRQAVETRISQIFGR